MKAVAGGKDLSKRSDHLPTFEELKKMMHLAYDGCAAVHLDPLRALQTGIEVALTHATGVRGQKTRTATFEHVWPRPYSKLAGGQGMLGTVLYNTRKGKTNEDGEATHSGWVSSRNPLFDIDGGLGLCMLYRFCNLGEPFPQCLADNGGVNPGFQYKWLPLFRLAPSEGNRAFDLDAGKALLPVREVGEKPQNACWNVLFAAAGVERYKGDSLTHGGRAACNQAWREDGGDVRISDEALGYTHNVSKDHYAPHIPVTFQLHRGGFGMLSAEHLGEADAAHLRAGRNSAAAAIKALVDLVLPELHREEAAVNCIITTPANLQRATVSTPLPIEY